jgi:hypothetical protein
MLKEKVAERQVQRNTDRTKITEILAGLLYKDDVTTDVINLSAIKHLVRPETQDALTKAIGMLKQPDTSEEPTPKRGEIPPGVIIGENIFMFFAESIMSTIKLGYGFKINLKGILNKELETILDELSDSYFMKKNRWSERMRKINNDFKDALDVLNNAFEKTFPSADKDKKNIHDIFKGGAIQHLQGKEEINSEEIARNLAENGLFDFVRKLVDLHGDLKNLLIDMLNKDDDVKDSSRLDEFKETMKAVWANLPITN